MRIAVIGSGIAGLGAAYVLSRVHDVAIFERESRLGGHANTVSVRRDGRDLALDTGFVVFNEANYPGLVRLFRELGVQTQPSDMSFSVSCRRCGIEWSGRRPLAQPGNVLRPAFLRLLRDVARWLSSARSALADPRYEDATLERYVTDQRYSPAFRDHFLVPLASAIWSTAPERALELPATYAIRFFDNHRMLGMSRHAWRTVTGGSRVYVRALVEQAGIVTRPGTPVRAIVRDDAGVDVRTEAGDTHRFDRAVVATHADQALALLADPSDDERRILGAFGYTRNETVLHTDERFLPATRAARASWNYQAEDCRSPAARPTMTYYLNRLQALAEPDHYCVTLNRTSEIREDRLIGRFVYDHPLYTVSSLRAQAELPLLAGVRNTAYCGAYHGFGFHEDGLASGVAAARDLGVEW